MKINNKINLLDCTLRDGGYYNQWDFDHALVGRYLKAIKLASITVVELGISFKTTLNIYGTILLFHR